MLSYISEAEELDELRTPPNFGFHPLTGDRAGAYAMTVTKNWRMTFKIDSNGAVIDMNLEDYH